MVQIIFLVPITVLFLWAIVGLIIGCSADKDIKLNTLVKKSFGDQFEWIKTYSATMELVYDKNTKIQFLWDSDDPLSGLLPVLDKNGQPQLYSLEEEEKND